MPALNQNGAQPNALLPASQLIAVTTETQIVSPLNPAIALAVTLPGQKWPYEGAVFVLNASGHITTVAAGTVTLKAYFGNSTTIASNTLLGSSGAITQNSSSAPWFLIANLIFDSVSGTLCGEIEFYVNKTRVGSVTLSNFPTGLNENNQVIATFSLTAQLSAPGAGATVVVNRFTVG